MFNLNLEPQEAGLEERPAEIILAYRRVTRVGQKKIAEQLKC